MSIEDDEEAVRERDARNAEYLKQEAEQDKQYAKNKQKKEPVQKKTTKNNKPEPSALDMMISGLLKPISAVAYLTAGLSVIVLAIYAALRFFDMLPELPNVTLQGEKFTFPAFCIALLSAALSVMVAGFCYKVLPKVKTANINLAAFIIKTVLCVLVGLFVYHQVHTFIVNLNWF